MSEKYRPVKGDRVRVVLEGEVERTGGDYFTIGNGADLNSIGCTATHVVSVEKVEPPVTVFKPGDVVRSKDVPSFKYLILRDGYAEVDTGRRFGELIGDSPFNSRYYELVDIK